MPRYNRILVRFRMPTEGWSELHWCDIEKTEEGIQTRVALFSAHGSMPTDDHFQPLSAEQAKKLMVIDCSGSSAPPRKAGAPLKVIADEIISKYCLITTDNELYRFNFDRRTPQLLARGEIWLDKREFSVHKQCSKPFTETEISSDSRLAMKTRQEAYHSELLGYEYSVMQAFQNQYLDWQQSLIHAHERKLAQEEQDRLLQEKRQQEETQRIERERARIAEWQKPINQDASIFSRPGLDELDQYYLHEGICAALSEIKRLAVNKIDYIRVLTYFLRQGPVPDNLSRELSAAAKRFREDFLINGGTLNGLFSKSESAHPTFSTVYNYVLDVVFEELKYHDSSYNGQSSAQIKKPCPLSDAEVKLGVPRRESLFVPQAAPDQDAGLALFLQAQELALNMGGFRAGQGNIQGDEAFARRVQNDRNADWQYPGRMFPARPVVPSRNPRLAVNTILICLGVALVTYGLYALASGPFSWISLALIVGVGAYMTLRAMPNEGQNNGFRFGM